MLATVESRGIADANTLRQHFLEQCLGGPSSKTTISDGQSIIIVGAGAFGSSLALELVTNYPDKYASVDVFDKWPVPSRDAASTDTTKIVRADYAESIYAKIVGEAIEIWKTELFAGTYHQTGLLIWKRFLIVGWILLNDETDTVCCRRLDTLRKYGLAQGVVEFKSGQEVTNTWEMFDGPMKGSGWANAAQATYRVASAAQKLGATFHTGPASQVISLLYDSTGAKLTGIKTCSGETFYGDKVVLCTGAWTNSLIDTKGQLVPKGYCLAHIQLTPAERARYANMPVFDDYKWDVYYFPPFEENGVMKIAGLSTGYTIRGEPRTQSDFPGDGIPKEAEEHLRRGMRASIPALAEKEMFDKRVCWCVDTPDLNFLITPHPDVSGLYLATGGSAHGFKFLPRIGYYIALMLEGSLPAEFADKWRWRAGQEWNHPPRTKYTLEGKDFKETEGWADSAQHGPMAHIWGNSNVFM